MVKAITPGKLSQYHISNLSYNYIQQRNVNNFLYPKKTAKLPAG